MDDQHGVKELCGLSVLIWPFVAFAMPFWGSVLCITLMLGGVVVYVLLADKRFATAQQIRWGRRICYGMIILNVFCLAGGGLAYWWDIRPWVFMVLPVATSILHLFIEARSFRRAHLRPPSALLCTVLEKRFLYRAAVWQRLMYFPDVVVVCCAIFSASDFWRGYVVQGTFFLGLVATFVMISIWMRRCRKAALAAASEQARYRYGTVGEILHPAFMSPIDRVVPAHIRQ